MRTRFCLFASLCLSALGADDSARGLDVKGRFSGSSNAYGQVYRFDPALDYRISRHFAIDAGVPLYFVRLSDTAGATTNTGNGLGDIYMTLKLDAYHPVVNLASSLRLGAPTGEQEKGLSTGRMTADWNNMLYRNLGRFTPFANLGLANTITDTPFFVRPFTSTGPVAQVEAGSLFPLSGPVSAGGSVYRVSPLGDQEIMRRTGQGAGPVSPPAGRGGGVLNRGRRPPFEPGVVVTGRDLAADHGASAWFSVRPVRELDFLIAYSQSIPYELNTISFGIGFRLGLTANRR